MNVTLAPSLLCRCAALFACLAAFLLPASAQVISVEFYGDQPEANRLTSTDVTGAVPAANWNGFGNSNASPGTQLEDSNGNLTAVTLDNYFSSTDSEPAPPVDPTPTELLFSSYIETQFSGQVGFTISNIPYTNYNLYVYGTSTAPGRRAILGISEVGLPAYYYATLGGIPDSFVQSTSTSAAEYTPANYVVFAGLSASSQTVTLFIPGGSTWSGVAGFQVQNVPEPASGALLLLALGGLGLRRKR